MKKSAMMTVTTLAFACDRTTGTSGTARSGFSYAENFRAWLQARGPSVIPWSWFGPPHSADGVASADALATIAPGQHVYVVEVGPGTPPDQVTAFAARLRQREPIAAIGFSTWPTRAEAEQAAVPWDACVDAFDFGLPQVCTPDQRQLLLREDSPVVEDMAGKPIHVATFPDADPNWVDSARLGVAEHAGASGFSVEQSSFGTWRRQLGALGEGRQELPPPAAPLPVRPVEVMLGKIVPYILVGFLQTALILVAVLIVSPLGFLLNDRLGHWADAAARCANE